MKSSKATSKAVIITVLKIITHKSVVCLPCCTDMMIESLTVAHAQLGEELTSREEINYRICDWLSENQPSSHFPVF